jgi:hypothetical protein
MIDMKEIDKIMDEFRNRTLYGYFSQKACDAYGSCYYLTPDEKEVRVTIVDSRSDISDIYLWDDYDEVGIVTKFIRHDALMKQNSELMWAMRRSW